MTQFTVQDDELDFRPVTPAPRTPEKVAGASSDGLDFQPSQSASRAPKTAAARQEEIDFQPKEEPATFESVYGTSSGAAPSLSERASSVGQPSPTVTALVRKALDNGFDTTSIPRSPFTNQLEFQPPIATEEETRRQGTIGPREQTLAGRALRAMGAGAPEGSRMAEWTGQSGSKDNLRLFAPEELMTESEQRRHPILTGAGEFAGGFTSPEGLALLGLTAGAGEVAGPGAQAMKRLLAAGFSGSMIFNAAQKVPAISQAIRTGDSYNAQRFLTQVALESATAGLAARGAFEEPAPVTVPKGTISSKLAMDEATTRGARRLEDFRANEAARRGIGNLALAERALEVARNARINEPLEVPKTYEGEPPILRGRPEGPERNPLEVEAGQVREQRAEREPPDFRVTDLAAWPPRMSRSRPITRSRVGNARNPPESSNRRNRWAREADRQL